MAGLISFDNLQKVLEEVLRQQRDTTATLQYLKATIEAHCSKEYVDDKMRTFVHQVGEQDKLLAKLRADMFDVSNIAAELPRLADSQAVGLVAIEQRLSVSIHAQLAAINQRTTNVEIELKAKATTLEMRRMRLELDDRPRREELKHLIDSTNKMRDALGERLDDLTERIWSMRNEGAASLNESTSVLDSKLQGTARQLATVENQQRSIAAMVGRIEKETLTKVTYNEVGALKKELFGQLHDVHKLLSSELVEERTRVSHLDAALTQANLAVAERATLQELSVAQARIDAHDKLLAKANEAIDKRSTIDALDAEAAERKAADAQIGAQLETKAELEALSELFVRASKDAARIDADALRSRDELDGRLHALQRELNGARELLARKADNVDLADLEQLHRTTAGTVSELKVDLENVLKSLEAWMFDEPLAEPMADPALATSAAADAAAATVARLSNASAKPPPPSNGTPTARAAAARAREPDATPRTTAAAPARAGLEAAAPASSLSRSGSGERRPPSSGPAQPPAYAGLAQPAAPGGSPSARSPVQPRQPLAASPTPSPRANLLASAGSAPSAPVSMREGAASPLSLAHSSNQPPVAHHVTGSGSAARTEVGVRKKALEAKRAALVAERLGGGAGDPPAALPPIRDLSHASK